MVCVDDLLLIGEDDKVKDFLKRLEKQLQLKHVKGRTVEYYGDHIAHSVTKDNYDSLLSLYNIKSNTSSLATSSRYRYKETSNVNLTPEEHSKYRTIVGKLLWMCPLRPDMQYATKELTRAVQKPGQNAKKRKTSPQTLSRN
eukprot:588007-Amphidinium_carterae.3